VLSRPSRTSPLRRLAPARQLLRSPLGYVAAVSAAFPEAFGSISSTLAIPLFLAALGIVLRGGAFALKGQPATIAEACALGAVLALSSVLPPFSLGAAAAFRL
jgi:cytochrome bd-type quinol oxidase subunit 2